MFKKPLLLGKENVETQNLRNVVPSQPRQALSTLSVGNSRQKFITSTTTGVNKPNLQRLMPV